MLLVVIKITVNGEQLEIDEGASVLGLLEHLDIAEKKVAVERNLEIVPRSQYASVELKENDSLEVVHFIGGG